MEKKTIGVLVGSLRKDSFCKKTARNVSELLSRQFEVKCIELGKLCMFNEDFDNEDRVPPEWAEFRKEIKKLDGVLFVCPEYNRSMPALLKNALDIGSRPYGQNLWNDKPGAIIGVTIGKLGALSACQVLKQTASFLGIHVMAGPEVYLSGAAALFGDKGELKDDSTKTLIKDFTESFGKWVERFPAL
jgi:chromate reductase